MFFEATSGFGCGTSGVQAAGLGFFRSRPLVHAPTTRGTSAPGRQAPAGGAEQRAGGPSSIACSAGAVRRRGRAFGDNSDEEVHGDLQRRRAAVIQYVRDTQPGEVQAFIDEAPPTVVAAMKQTVSNMVGTLPPQQFAVTISTVAESLASLMQTMLRTGYLLRGVQYQLELELALQSAAASMLGHAPAPAAHAPPEPAVEVPMPPPEPAVEVPMPPSPSTSSASASSVLVLPATGAGAGALIPEIVGALGLSAAAAAAAPSGGGSQALEVRDWSQPEEQYAPGVQLNRVEGDVMRWHMAHGLERMPAASYIRLLEQKVAALQQQVQQQTQQQQQQQTFGAAGSGFQPFPPLFTSSAAGATAAAMMAGRGVELDGLGGRGALGSANPVLAYLRSLDSTSVAALGACGPDVSDAMQLFVARLMGTTEHEQLKQMTSEFTAVELSKLLFWLLVVGWSLRAMEVRLEVEDGFSA